MSTKESSGFSVDDIRPERSITRYSRGAELFRAIHTMWEGNRGLGGEEIERRIYALMDEYDLTTTTEDPWTRKD